MAGSGRFRVNTLSNYGAASGIRGRPGSIKANCRNKGKGKPAFRGHAETLKTSGESACLNA